MKMCGRYIFFLLLISLFSCSQSDDAPGISVFSASFDFNQSQDGWEADFTDLPANLDDTSFYQLKFEYTDLPSHLGDRKSLMLSGNNHSDDLFMFIKGKVTGLIPNTSYNVVFEVELASNAPAGSVGAGGSPGESVYLKAGASGIEPKKITQSDKYVLNIDKGNQSTSGENAIVLGDISIPSTSTDYALILRSNASSTGHQPFIVQSNDAGEIWLVVGTDSGFEGVTTVYYTKVNVVFSASN
jgi:hypothetical protein